jgi:hypothetical protein
MRDMMGKSKNVIAAHLKHLKVHGETIYLKQAMGFLSENKSKLDFNLLELADEVHHSTPNENQTQPVKHKISTTIPSHGGGCPGSQAKSFVPIMPIKSDDATDQPSALTQWPVQMHLINPMASYFQDADLLIAADCVAFSLGNFHSKFLPGKKLAIACPKLDSNKEIYLEKMIRLIDQANVNTITVMIMEVPCCGGLIQLVLNAVKQASRKVPVKAITVGIQGTVLSEEWV